jgi:cytoskeletal protein RodZ
MVRGFSKKKIALQKTLGETLKEKRAELKISLSEAEVGSKVRAKFLSALENEEWKKLPSAVYARGFVLAYAKFLGLDKEKIVELYDGEVKIQGKEERAKIAYNQPLKEKRVLITPKILTYSGLAIFVVGLFSYIIFQVMHFAGDPNLKILSPANNTVTESETVTLSGITDSDTLVVVNNENVPVTNDGHFQSAIKLHRGINVIKVQALSKAKKESSEVYTIEYKPKTAALTNKLEQ